MAATRSRWWCCPHVAPGKHVRYVQSVSVALVSQIVACAVYILVHATGGMAAKCVKQGASMWRESGRVARCAHCSDGVGQASPERRRMHINNHKPPWCNSKSYRESHLSLFCLPLCNKTLLRKRLSNIGKKWLLESPRVCSLHLEHGKNKRKKWNSNT